MQISVSFAPEEGPTAAAVVATLVDALDETPKPAGKEKLTAHAGLPDVIRLYEQMAENESPRFLEALSAKPMLFEEIAERMASDGGTLHGPASVRAIYRNVKRREKGLIDGGLITAPVVQADFDNYATEGAGRYYLEGDALQALDGYLGR